MSGRGVVTLGETMGLLTAGAVGHLRHVPTMALSIGGAESNVAIALARLGTPVSWIGRLGADSVGDKVLRELTAEGVGVHAQRDPVAPTGLMLKERPPGGATRVWYYRAHGAGARLSPADVDEKLIATAALLHVTGITPALGDDPAAAVRKAVDVAREAGVPVSIDINYRSALWPPEDELHRATRAQRHPDHRLGGVVGGQREGAARYEKFDIPIPRRWHLGFADRGSRRTS